MRVSLPALLISLALAGCAADAPLPRPAAPVPATYPGGPAYAPAPPSGAPPQPVPGWRDFLRDARLQLLVELALHNNRDLRVAALNVEQVRAQHLLTHAALAPQVTLGAGVQRQSAESLSGTHSGVARNLSTDVAAAWELDFFGRLHSLDRAALEQYLASAYAQQAARLLLVAQVADQYLVLRAADEQLAVTADLLSTSQAALDLMVLQFKVGSVSELDLQQARGTVELAQAQLAAQQRDRAQAGNALALLVGQPLPADLPPGMDFDAPGLLADIPVGLPSDLLTRRPDIAQAEALLQAEHADLAAARADFFPRIGLTGSVGSAAPALSSLLGAGTGVWSFAPTLLMPLFDRGANRANLAAARVRQDIGVAQYEKAVQTAFREVADGLAARGTYGPQLDALQRYSATQQRRLELARRLYDNGIDNYLEVLTAQTDAYTARGSVVTARLNRLTSLVGLFRALGGGWEEPAAAPQKTAAIGYADRQATDNAATTL